MPFVAVGNYSCIKTIYGIWVIVVSDRKIIFAPSPTFKVKLELNKNREMEHQNFYRNDYKPPFNTSVFASKFEYICNAACHFTISML